MSLLRKDVTPSPGNTRCPQAFWMPCVHLFYIIKPHFNKMKFILQLYGKKDAIYACRLQFEGLWVLNHQYSPSLSSLSSVSNSELSFLCLRFTTGEEYVSLERYNLFRVIVDLLFFVLSTTSSLPLRLMSSMPVGKESCLNSFSILPTNKALCKTHKNQQETGAYPPQSG